MKGGFRQSMTWLHGWSGLVAGWLLFAIFLTGTTVFFRHEISAWMRPELALPATPPDANRAAAAAVRGMAERAPEARSWFIGLPDARNPATSAVWRGRSPDAPAQRATLDPVTGAPLNVRGTLGGDFFFRFHFDLHMPPLWGRLMVGAAAMTMLVAIVTGIVAHRRIVKDVFTFRPGAKAAQRSWLDGHNAAAVLALPFHLVITYSGLVTLMLLYMPWGVSAAYRGDQGAFLADTGVRPAVQAPAGRPAPLVPLAPLLEEAARRWNGGAPGAIVVHNPGDANALIEIARRVGDRLSVNGERLRFDGVTGALLEAPDMERGAILTHGSVYGLHIAHFAGPWTRAFLFLSGLAGTAMVATGLILWTMKARQRAARENRRPGFGTALAERLNVATLAGLPAAMAAFFAANRLLPAGLDGRAEAEVGCFFAVWAAALLHALLRPPAAAWGEQLRAAALMALAVPLLDFATTGRLADLAAGRWDPERVGFDAVLLAAGAGFALAARTVGRRGASAANLTERSMAGKEVPSCR